MISEEAIEVFDYKCPRCKTHPNEEYTINGTEYPIKANERNWDNDWGSRLDWDEYHICENCGTKFWFVNGAF